MFAEDSGILTTIGELFTPVLSDVQGILQDRVAKLLQCRSKINEMSRSPILTISDKARNLLITQSTLEGGIGGAVEKAQTGEISDILLAGEFIYSMETQISNVNKLWDEYKGLGSSAQASLINGIPDWLIFTGIGGAIFYVIRRRKKHK